MNEEEELLWVELPDHKEVFNLENVVYLIKNPEGLYYVGKTAGKCRRRFTYYCNLDCRPQRRLYESLVKYGIENHLVTILEFSLEKEELSDREQYWIKYYDSFNNGLNLSWGGDGVKIKEG